MSHTDSTYGMTNNGLSVWLQKRMGLGTFLSRGKIYFFIFSVNEIRFFEFWVEKSLKQIILRKSRNCDFLLSAERHV